MKQRILDLLAHLLVMTISHIVFRVDAQRGTAQQPPDACIGHTLGRFALQFDAAVIQLEADLVKIRIAHVDDHAERVAIGVPGRLIADLIALAVLPLELGPALVNIQVAAGHIGEGQHIRVCLCQIAGRSHQKQPRVLIEQDFCALTQGAGDLKRGDLSLVFLPVGQLILDLCNRTLAAFTEPGGDALCAVFAHVPVLQLAVPQ